VAASDKNYFALYSIVDTSFLPFFLPSNMVKTLHISFPGEESSFFVFDVCLLLLQPINDGKQSKTCADPAIKGGIWAGEACRDVVSLSVCECWCCWSDLVPQTSLCPECSQFKTISNVPRLLWSCLSALHFHVTLCVLHILTWLSKNSIPPPSAILGREADYHCCRRTWRRWCVSRRHLAHFHLR